MSQAGRWSADRARQIGERIKRLRGNRTAQWLADRCTELGHPMSRSAIAKLENGRREDLGQSEIDIMARALGLPPVLLLFPVGEVAEVEVLPGDVRNTWDALRWFTGEPPQNFTRGERDSWLAVTEPLRQYRRHQDLLLQLQRHELRKLEAFSTGLVRTEGQEPATPEQRDTAEQVMRAEERAVADLEGQLISLRSEMRQRGYVLPPLPTGRKYLDQEAEVSE